MIVLYNFEEQLEKGKKYEQHFFDFLHSKGLSPEFHKPNENNREFDILSLGKKYEVKADFFNNMNFPLEIQHFGKNWQQGWLFKTESDFVVFYKPKWNGGQAFIFKTSGLKEAYFKCMLLVDKYRFTTNETYVTVNFMADITLLDKALIKVLNI